MPTSFAVLTDIRLTRKSLFTLPQGVPLNCELDWGNGSFTVDFDPFCEDNPYAVQVQLVNSDSYGALPKQTQDRWEALVGRTGGALLVSYAIPSRLTAPIIHHVAARIWAIDKRARVLVYSFADDATFTPRPVDWDRLYEELMYQQGA